MTAPCFFNSAGPVAAGSLLTPFVDYGMVLLGFIQTIVGSWRMVEKPFGSNRKKRFPRPIDEAKIAACHH